MTSRELEEYKSLRATIRERGTLRVLVFVGGIIVWAGFAIAVLGSGHPPLLVAVTLFVLAAAFEAVFALHAGVERIGRYIQVFHESPNDHGWESRIMGFGATRPGPGSWFASDPLFALYFAVAAALNLLLSARATSPRISPPLLAAHLLFVIRLLVARRQAARQRGTDLSRFQKVQTGDGSPVDAH